MSVVDAPPSSVRRGRGRRVALLVLALGQVASSAASQLVGSSFQTPDRPGEPPIVPVGPTFSVWGLIVALSVAYAVWALPAGRVDRDLRDRLAVPLLVVFAGFTLWLVAAQVEPLWTTVVIFTVMLVALLKALAVAREERGSIARWSPLGRGLLWGMLGTYTGWSSIAVWVNLTTGLAGSGAPITGTAGVVGQLAILAGATATAVAVLRFSGGLLTYAATVAWALGGAALGARGAGEPLLAWTAVAGLVVVAVALVALRLGGRGAPA